MTSRTAAVMFLVFPLIGCDPNPGGPSAPIPTAAERAAAVDDQAPLSKPVPRVPGRVGKPVAPRSPIRGPLE